jgi:hypothetical protein
MPGLMTLPNELLLDIASHLGTGGIYSLVRTNRLLHQLLEPRLYQHPSERVLRRVIDTGNLAVFERFLKCGLDTKTFLEDVSQKMCRVDTRGLGSDSCRFNYPVLAYVVCKRVPARWLMLRALLDSGLINISEWSVLVEDWAARRPFNEGHQLAQLLSKYGVPMVTGGACAYIKWSKSNWETMFSMRWGNMLHRPME